VKILLTTHQFFPEYFSGTEVLTLNVAKELTKRGHEVAVFTGFPAAADLPDDKRFDSYIYEGLRVFRFHNAHSPMGDQSGVAEIEYDNHLAAKYFTQTLGEFSPEIVHIFHMSRLGGGIIDTALDAKLRAYFTPTDFWSICVTSQLHRHGKICAGPSPLSGNCAVHMAELTQGKAAQLLGRCVPDSLADLAVKLSLSGKLKSYPQRDNVIALSKRKGFLVSRLNKLRAILTPTELMADTLAAHGVSRRLMIRCAYGLDTAAITPGAPVGNNPLPVIGFIGTLAPHKGCHVLIDAFKRLAPNRAVMKIYGNLADFPAYAASLQKKAEGAPGIEFCGTFATPRIGEILAGLDMLVIPSLWHENMPLVMGSALAAQRPLVVSDFGGLTETVKDGWNGLVFPAGDSEALARRLLRLLDEPGLLQELARNTRPPKSISTYVDELLAIYAR